MADDYKVRLDTYNGPLDLLLFLIRRDEIDIYNIPIAALTRQYLDYVALLKRVDPDHIGEFLVMAATLMEIKSRTLLPAPEVEEAEEDFGDPRLELVRQLLEYKQFKDLARELSDAADHRAQRFGRLPVLPKPAGPEVDLDYVQVWDLLSAFNRLLGEIGLRQATHDVLYDDTPLALHAADIIDRLSREDRSMRFLRLFEGRAKGEVIGLFLALLELIRSHRVRAEQHGSRDDIVVHLLDDRPLVESEIDPALSGDGGAGASEGQESEG